MRVAVARVSHRASLPPASFVYRTASTMEAKTTKPAPRAMPSECVIACVCFYARFLPINIFLLNGNGPKMEESKICYFAIKSMIFVK
jgi:hypothetical protein